MIVIYTTHGNMSSKKAKEFFMLHKKKFVEKNVQTAKLSKKEIRNVLTKCENGTEDIISTRSLPYKAIKEKIEDMKLEELIGFIQNKPNILKLPIIMNDEFLLTGWDDDEIEMAYRMQ